jgi:hypothetical protein
MAQPVTGPKELNLNKPKVFDGNRDGFKEFLQNVEVYMDVNHETYNNNLRTHGRHNSLITPTLNPLPPILTTDWGRILSLGKTSWRHSHCLIQLKMH